MEEFIAIPRLSAIMTKLLEVSENLEGLEKQCILSGVGKRE